MVKDIMKNEELDVLALQETLLAAHHQPPIRVQNETAMNQPIMMAEDQHYI